MFLGAFSKQRFMNEITPELEAAFPGRSEPCQNS
jgi:hypothetical protein